jgi:pimeloyl-ACP methyl ester carboxylesterase
MERPLPAYTGKEPFTFVCYAHDDAKIVYPEIQWLDDQGVHLWYDEGISAGKNWRAAIGDSLLGASHVLFYISQQSLESDHCNREINLALDEGKHVVPVYLEEIELTSDLKIGLNRLQALTRTEEGNYQQNLLNALQRPAIESGTQSDPIDQSTTSTATANLDRRKWPLTVSVVGALFAIVLALGYYFRDELLFTLVMNAPTLFVADLIEQELAFVTTPDGTRIAYATSGEGPPIVQVLGFGTHLESGTSSPIYDNDGLLAMTSRDHLFVRYDGRGFGMSDRNVEDFSVQARVSDLKAVVDAIGLEHFNLFAVSAGGPVGIMFTVQHPERVSRLVLAGAYASPDWMDEEWRDYMKRMTNLFEIDWHRPTVTNMFASKLLAPSVDDLSLKIVGQLLRRSVNGNDLASFLRAHWLLDTRDQAKQINVPTLVIQASDDDWVNMAAGRELAALVPGSKLEVVTGGHLSASGSSPGVRRLILDFFEAVE